MQGGRRFCPRLRRPIPAVHLRSNGLVPSLHPPVRRSLSSASRVPTETRVQQPLAPQPRPAIQHPSPAAESCHRLHPCHGNLSDQATPPERGGPAVSHRRRPAAAAPRQSALASLPPASRSKIGSHGSHRKKSPFLPSSDGVAQSPESWLGSDPHLRSETAIGGGGGGRVESGKERSVALLDSLLSFPPASVGFSLNITPSLFSF